MPDNVQDREFLGRGLAWPLQFDPRGGIALAAGDRDIEQAIRIILETVPGERVMRPEFGCHIHDLVFAPHDSVTEGLAVQYVEQALERWEPRITVQEVEVASDPAHDGVMLMEIRYLVKDTHDERSIVYPFSVAEEEAPV